MRYTEKEKLEALEIWEKSHPNETNIRTDEKIELPSGVVVKLGIVAGNMKMRYKSLSEEKKVRWGKYLEKQIQYLSDAEKLEALEIWQKENPDETFIPRKVEIKIHNGKTVPLGIIMANKKYKKLESPDDPWEKYLQRQRMRYTIEEYKEALKIWEATHPTETNVPARYKVKLENGRKIPLGRWIADLKSSDKKLSEEEKLIFGKYLYPQVTMATEEEYREAYELWQCQNPDKIYMKVHTSVIITNGKKINIGMRIDNMKHNREMLPPEKEAYWSLKGVFLDKKELFQAQKKQLELKYWRNIKENIAKTENQIEREMERKQAFSIWKKKNITRIAPSDAKSPDSLVVIENGKEIKLMARLDKVKKSPEKLSREERRYWEYQGLYNNIYKTNYKRYQEESMSLIYKSQMLLSSEGEKKACWVTKCLEATRKKKMFEELGPSGRDTGDYEKEILESVLKYHEIFKEESVDQLVDRAINESKSSKLKPAGWIYEKYGFHIWSILEYLNLNAASILKNMSEEILPLEEAICDEIFFKNNKKARYEWLEVPIQYLKTNLTGENIPYQIFSFAKSYHLNKEELEIVRNSLYEYWEVMREYQKMEVGLEVEQEKKVEKAKRYVLSSEEIEESYFMPLELDSDCLTEKEKGEYNRKQLLRQYVIDWNFYEENEKLQVIKYEHMTKEEVYQVNKARTQLDEMIKESSRKEIVPVKRK